ncbi:BlaI/MecI/CopY family transcriptional regulator [Clostridium sp. 'deep sea']|uniref:BlaI/MecI/CopY family transcriptional regulator n=1 Tax=Clostridium sp. 'deep sea' TaxID=2779445 RepID=UPI00325FA975
MNIKVFDAEYKFMEIVWNCSHINSTALVKLCESKLGWKKSTTYTTIKRLSKRGIVKNENAIVTYLVSKNEVCLKESRDHLNKLYNGSVKMFLTNFLSKETLSKKEILELKSIIDEEIEKVSE